MSVTPKPEPYCVALVTSSSTPVIGSVVPPLALVVLGMSIATAPTGAVGAEPLVGNCIVVLGSAAPVPSTLIGVPFAVTYTSHWSAPDFWK